MRTTQRKRRATRILFIAGVLGLVAGAIDPLEGSVIILGGGGCITLSRWLGDAGRTLAVYWSWLLGLMVFGVAAMFALSAMGGIGGKNGHSLWWALTILPYPIGWLLGVANLIARLIERFTRRGCDGAVR